MGLQTDMAIHSSIIAWEVPGTDKPGDHGVPKERHDWATKQQETDIFEKQLIV